jgi:hypothetical protein
MPKLSRGTFVILLMVAAAVGLSIYAAWYRYQAGDDALRFWGREAAVQIRGAEKVELLILADKSEQPAATDVSSESNLKIQGASYTIAKTIDITTARGLIHARNALLEDASLDAQAAPPATTPHWDRVLRFKDANGSSTSIAIDLKTAWISRTDTGAMIKLKKPDFKQEKRDPGLVAYVKKFAPENEKNAESTSDAPTGKPEKGNSRDGEHSRQCANGQPSNHPLTF